MTTPKYKMTVTVDAMDSTQSRIIIECNGFEIDILADDDGIHAEIKSGETVHTSCNFDFAEV